MRVVVGIGSNLGARLAKVRAAAALLSDRFESLAPLSPVVETPALVWPGHEAREPEPSFRNAAIALEVDDELERVLDALLAVERRFHRTRERRWAPRTLDLDLLWAERPWSSARLEVPHPRLLERSFALQPLLAVADDAGLPVPDAWRARLEGLERAPLAPRVRYEPLGETGGLRVVASDRADALAHAVSLLAREWYVVRPDTLSLVGLEVPVVGLPRWGGSPTVDLVPGAGGEIELRPRLDSLWKPPRTE